MLACVQKENVWIREKGERKRKSLSWAEMINSTHSHLITQWALYSISWAIATPTGSPRLEVCWIETLLSGLLFWFAVSQSKLTASCKTASATEERGDLMKCSWATSTLREGDMSKFVGSVLSQRKSLTLLFYGTQSQLRFSLIFARFCQQRAETSWRWMDSRHRHLDFSSRPVLLHACCPKLLAPIPHHDPESFIVVL